MLNFEELELEAKQANDTLASIRTKIIDNGIIPEVGLTVSLKGEVEGESYEAPYSLSFAPVSCTYPHDPSIIPSKKAKTVEEALRHLTSLRDDDFYWQKLIYVNAYVALGSVYLGEVSIDPERYPDLFLSEEEEEKYFGQYEN